MRIDASIKALLAFYLTLFAVLKQAARAAES